MTKLPIIKPLRLVKMLKKIGFEEVRQKGSHLQLKRLSDNVSVTVPMHQKDIGLGLLKAIIKQANISEEDFLRLD